MQVFKLQLVILPRIRKIPADFFNHATGNLDITNVIVEFAVWVDDFCASQNQFHLTNFWMNNSVMMKTSASITNHFQSSLLVRSVRIELKTLSTLGTVLKSDKAFVLISARFPSVLA